MTTIPNVFIIESLHFEDEEKDLFEGQILSRMLNLNDKPSKYYYIRTERELEGVVDKFYESKYRYLHLSCHGDPVSMGTTLDDIPFDRLGKILEPCLHNRRLFVSACEMVNHALAEAVIPNSDCYSILGPSKKVDVDDAAILWASFYHLMFNHAAETMKRDAILAYSRRLATLFGVPLNYFSKDGNKKSGFRFTAIKPGPAV